MNSEQAAVKEAQEDFCDWCDEEDVEVTHIVSLDRFEFDAYFCSKSCAEAWGCAADQDKIECIDGKVMTDGGIGTSGDGGEHTECAVCGYEPDPDRIPPHYVLSLDEDDESDETVESYPFGGSLSVPFACSDECWLDAQDNPELMTDGGNLNDEPTQEQRSKEQSKIAHRPHIDGLTRGTMVEYDDWQTHPSEKGGPASD